jgi:insertion element IS1 protein InsB
MKCAASFKTRTTIKNNKKNNNKKNKRGLWLALYRRTRQIVSFARGDRSAKTCRRLFLKLPPEYRNGQSFSDFGEAYQKAGKTGKHQSVGKESGETAHVERWNNTLRQRLARYVRKALSFSQSLEMHEACLLLFIHRYNREKPYFGNVSILLN